MTLVPTRRYRPDIDGLRALAVVPVILYHLGCLPSGFLGVDVFFVISGYLITGIIWNERRGDRFSLTDFYVRRIRRIIPLAVFTSTIAFLVGLATMLPDDLENLAESIVATNLFANNILQAVTTKDYWDVINEYKPLMHTWSLGVEEQYYLCYPLAFFLAGKTARRLLSLLLLLTIVSLALFLLPFPDYQKFYLLPFRFYELSLGGLAAVLLNNRLVAHRFSPAPIAALVVILGAAGSSLPRPLALLTTVLLSLAVLAAANDRHRVSALLLENRLVVAIGAMSFSLYMWHQIVLAYARYLFVGELRPGDQMTVLGVTVILSVLSYHLIEQPFRNRGTVNTRTLVAIVASALIVTTAAAFYVYLRAGVIRDVPELNLKAADGQRGMHAAYNRRIFDYRQPFRTSDRLRVLVVGDSFARDWANVVLESTHGDGIELSYMEVRPGTESISQSEAADVIFYSNPRPEDVQALREAARARLWIVGDKSFGASNGIFYNYKGDNYYLQRASIDQRYLEENRIARERWKGRYLDFFEKGLDDAGRMPVFTPSHKFISQDCRHLTKAGAQYFAQLFGAELTAALGDGATRR